MLVIKHRRTLGFLHCEKSSLGHSGQYTGLAASSLFTMVEMTITWQLTQNHNLEKQKRFWFYRGTITKLTSALGEIKLLPSHFAHICVKENCSVTIRVSNGEYVLLYIIVTFYVTYRREISTFVDKILHNNKYAAGMLLRLTELCKKHGKSPKKIKINCTWILR